MEEVIDISSLLERRRDELNWLTKDSLRDESLVALLTAFLGNSSLYESRRLLLDRRESMKFLGVVGANLGREDVREFLCSFLSNQEERADALEALQEFDNNHGLLEKLIGYSQARNFRVRYAAVDVLQNLRDSRVEEFVLSSMGQIKDKHFLCHLLRTLDLNGSEKSIGPLLELIKVNRSTDVRREVTLVLLGIAKRNMLSHQNLKIVQRFLDNSVGFKEYRKPVRVSLERMREAIEERFGVETSLIESEIGSYRLWATFDVYPYGVQFLTYGVKVLDPARIFPGSCPGYPNFSFQVDSKYFGEPGVYQSLSLEQVLADYDQKSLARLLRMRDTLEEFRAISFADFSSNEEEIFNDLAINKQDPIELPTFLNLIQLKEPHPEFPQFLGESSRFPLRPGERGADMYRAYIKRNLVAP